MGISFGMIEKMRELDLFGQGGISVLDIGSSNLYSATTDGILKFLNAYKLPATPELEKFADMLAKGSVYDMVSGGINGSFVGELFEKAGFRYDAIDIADGYQTTILDLNHEVTPPQFVGVFDLVLNFGTTEHLLNQYNAFKVMHDCTKVGGYIVNSLPCVGYSDHGYFTYTPRCMFDLAGYNEYELFAFWFDGPGKSNDLSEPLRNYQSYFPVLSSALAKLETPKDGRNIGTLDIPDIALTIIYRKIKDRPFMGALERSTSVGAVPQSVTSGYETKPTPMSAGNRQHIASGKMPPAISSSLDRHNEIHLSGAVDDLRKRFASGKLDLEQSLKFYNMVVEASGSFPLDWEYSVLLLALEREPDRVDLIKRLALVRKALQQ